MTSTGGLYGYGTIFEYEIGNLGGAQVKIFDFDGVNSGSSPRGDLVEASNGMLYGLTWSGGAYDSGVLFEFDPATSAFTNKLNFPSYTDSGYAPAGSLIEASNGRLYGCTTAGGLFGKGVLFEYRIVSGTNYVKRFDFDSISGSYPYGNPVEANNGTIYGMTSTGGDYDMGVIYSYVLGEYMAQSIMSFNGAEKGAHPKGSMMMASDGKLYGLTTGGGDDNGVIFQYDVGSSVFNKLKNFKSEENLFGIHPYGKLLKDQAGNFYGTNRTCFFEFNPNSDTMYKRLDFENNDYQIDRMDDVLLTDDAKAIFITKYNPPSGMHGGGAIFSLNLNSGILDSLYGFGIADYEGNPSSIIMGNNGLIYGTTMFGGSFGYGSVFSFDLNTLSYTDIASFDASNGVNPDALVQASDNMLYGFSQPHRYGIIGAFFKIDPETLSFTKLMDNYTSEVKYLITAPNGNLYWVGSYYGTFMEYNPYSMLLFERSSEFANSPLLPMADGRIFGILSNGGSNGEGSLFEYHPASFQLINKMNFNDSIAVPSSLDSTNASPPISADFHLKVFFRRIIHCSGNDANGWACFTLVTTFWTSSLELFWSINCFFYPQQCGRLGIG